MSTRDLSGFVLAWRKLLGFFRGNRLINERSFAVLSPLPSRYWMLNTSAILQGSCMSSFTPISAYAGRSWDL